jgi:hypothetical protein
VIGDFNFGGQYDYGGGNANVIGSGTIAGPRSELLP